MTVKFRAWDGEKIIEDFLVARPQFADCLSLMTNEKFAQENYHLKEWKLMQYTDTHDKNGKRVCESDIVHVSRQIIHVDDEYKEDWNHPHPIERASLREQLVKAGFVLIGEYEEIGIVKKNPTRWAFSPYVAKTVSFEHSRVNEKWHIASKSRGLRVNRGLWVVEVVGNIYETPEVYKQALNKT